MSSRRRNPLFSSNLDALMDTVTNVVGILIVILILMQVGVGQSLKKILSDLPQVSEEELARMKEEAEEQRRRHELLQDTIDKQRMRTDTERKELARLNPELTTLETAAERSPVAILDMASIKGKNLDNARELDSLRRQMAELLAEQAKLKAALDTTPAVAPPPDKIVRIPNSRPLADSSKMEHYLVTNGYIYGYDPEGAKKLLLQEFRNAGFRLEKEKIKQPDGTTQIIYDQDKVVKFFEQRHLMLGGMEIRVPYNQTGTRLTMELVPSPTSGQTVSNATQFTSKFQNDLRRMKAGNVIAWFNVTRGAFDTYLQAREVCESIGTAAGWELVTNAVYTEPLTEFDVNRMIEPPPPPPPRTPPPGTPRPPRATPVPMPKASPPPAPIKIDPPKKKLD
jgi:hypothetical protein